MVKNEHYIPKFYLKKFANKNEIISAYNFQLNKIIDVNIKNIGCKNHFYDIDLKELKDVLQIYKDVFNIDEEVFQKQFENEQFIENTFSKLESKMASYFVNFENDYSLINNEEFLSTLYLFMRTLSLRTLNYRKDLENMSTQTTNWLKSLNIKNVSNYPLDKEPKEIAKISQLSEILDLPRLYKKSLLFFENYEFLIGVNNTGFDFLISDNPMIYFIMGFNDICFPINPKLAIIMQHKKAKKEFKVCNFEKNANNVYYLKELDVLKYNILQCNSNANYLFGKKKMIQAQLRFIDYIKSKRRMEF